MLIRANTEVAGIKTPTGIIDLIVCAFSGTAGFILSKPNKKVCPLLSVNSYSGKNMSITDNANTINSKMVWIR